MTENVVVDCFACREHRDRGPLIPGGPVAEDELVAVSHIVTPGLPGRDGATACLGRLPAEPKRHAPGLGYWHRAWCPVLSEPLADPAGPYRRVATKTNSRSGRSGARAAAKVLLLFTGL